MKLTLLEPHFYRYEVKIEPRNFIVGPHETWHERGEPVEEKIVPSTYLIHVDTVAEAHGIRFLCPKCYQDAEATLTPEQRASTDLEAHGIGVHGCHVDFAGRDIPEGAHGMVNQQGLPVRWSVTGTNFEDLSTSPSILLIGGCNWHGYITNGEVSII